MVCIAAFIILAICLLTVPIIRLFNKSLADNIVSLFKKATHCFTRRVTLRACDTSFKDDVKNSMLRRVVLKHPGWVKPLSISIEVASFLIIVLTAWSLVVGAKSLVSLYVYGTCNPSSPGSCSLDSGEACTIDAAPIEFNKEPIKWLGNWFGEFGNAIKAIPVRMKTWNASDYLPEVTSYYGGKQDGKPLAVDIFDPGCSACRTSFNAQKEAGFFDKYNVALLAYPIKDTTTKSGYKYRNSRVIVNYLTAVQLQPPKDSDNTVAWQIVERLYNEKTDDGDVYQNAFNMAYSEEKAETVLQDWLSDFGYTDKEIKQLVELTKSDAVAQAIYQNYHLVNEEIQTKKIPTIIYDGRRHDGGFSAS